MTFHALSAWWWPYVFILLAGWLPTDIWRYLGVIMGRGMSEESEILVFVRAVATALVAAVIARLIFFPSGALAASPIALRLVAAAVGFGGYLLLGKRVIVGVALAEAVLIAGLYTL